MELTAPTQLNGVQLQKELKDAGIKLHDYPRLNNGILELDIDKKDEVKAKSIVVAHLAVDDSAAKATARQVILDRLGLTADDAKLLLG